MLQVGDKLIVKGYNESALAGAARRRRLSEGARVAPGAAAARRARGDRHAGRRAGAAPDSRAAPAARGGGYPKL